MTTLKQLTVLFFFFTFSQSIFSQSENLKNDEAFFKNQEKIYQKWLDHSGLGKTLSVNATIVKEDKLILYLQFPFSDTDSVTNAWNQLKTDFEKKNSLSLEQELFYKMVSIMELRQSMAFIQLYDTYDTRVEYCFKRDIFYKDERVLIEKEMCRAKKEEVHFDASDFSNLRDGEALKISGENGNKKKLTPIEIRAKFPRRLVFDRILNFAKNKYEKTKCDKRYPKVRVLENKEVLRLEIVDLCREVIEEGNPNTCEILKWFGHDCNWIKRERLILTFSYVETSAGFSIHCIIDGAYGSGYYDQVRRGGYINMEVDFDLELEHYADLFKEEIRTLFR